jgi:hypothetical protein
MASIRKVLPGLVLACAMGCDGNVDSEPPRLISVDQPLYTSSYISGDGIYETFGFRIVATVTNPGSRPLRFARCTPETTTPMYGLVPVSGGETAYSAGWGCAGGTSPFVVLPGATRVDTLFTSGPNAWAGTPRQPVGVLEGTLELWVEEEGCDAACEPIRSQPFVVRVAPR